MFHQKIEAVTVCIGYADFLKEAIPWNLPHFNRWIIVTSKEDEATRELCRKYRLQCLVTNDHNRDGAFSKGRMIERGLQHCSSDSWLLHIDADIVLPSSFRYNLERANLNKECIYGVDRFMVNGWTEWKRLLNSGWLNKHGDCYPHGIGLPKGFTLGDRWAGQDGWLPIGYFQLFHRLGGGEEWRGYRTKSYPNNHGSACRGDVQFSLLWDRQDRVLIPEIFVAHLSSEEAKTGANWNGRTTKPFKG